MGHAYLSATVEIDLLGEEAYAILCRDGDVPGGFEEVAKTRLAVESDGLSSSLEADGVHSRGSCGAHRELDASASRNAARARRKEPGDVLARLVDSDVGDESREFFSSPASAA